MSAHAGKYLKPYQGLKLGQAIARNNLASAGKYLKPYQGLKRPILLIRLPTNFRRKIPKTLSGIETNKAASYNPVALLEPENT